MYIWLCYKKYKVKFTCAAKREFEELYDRDLLGSMQEVTMCFLGESVAELKAQAMARSVMHEGKAAVLFHAIINAADPNITIDEVEDAVARTPWRRIEGASEKCLPWTVVMHQMGVEYDRLMGGVAPTKKPSAAILELLGQE